MTKSKLLKLAIIILVLISVGLIWHNQSKVQPKANVVSKNQAKVTKPTFDKQLYSTTDPNSIWVVVNKLHPLSPISFAPTDLVIPSVPLRSPGNDNMHVSAKMAPSLETMFAAAKQDNIDLMLTSGYRSYAYQVSLYNGYVASMGVTETDKVSARPGYSEHQTGFAADLEPVSHDCELDPCFATTPEGQWLAANAYKYGFLVRYAADKTAVTGYNFEPWHVRYVGVLLSTEMHNQGIQTLEEFFNITGGGSYN